MNQQNFVSPAVVSVYVTRQWGEIYYNPKKHFTIKPIMLELHNFWLGIFFWYFSFHLKASFVESHARCKIKLLCVFCVVRFLGAVIFYCVLNSSYGKQFYFFLFRFERVVAMTLRQHSTQYKYRASDKNGSNRFNKMCIMFWFLCDCENGKCLFAVGIFSSSSSSLDVSAVYMKHQLI